MSKSKTVIVTGGLGFIGSHFIEHVIRKTNWNIVILDKVSYATNGFHNLRSADLMTNPRIRLFTWDLTMPLSVGIKKEIGQNINYIIHIAAESDVNRSITDPVFCVQNNINSTLQMLEYARELPTLEKFYYFSTDECYGVPEGDYAFKETDKHCPRNPYSASKSACEMICMAYENTYKTPIISSSMNNSFGERQHHEKFIPLCIKSILNDEKIYIHADSTATIPGSRSYIHARNVADAILFILKNGQVGECYNINSRDELDNLDLALKIAQYMGKDLNYELVNFHDERPGHDLVYRLDPSKLMNLGWKQPVDFDKSLEKTIDWYLNNQEWFEL